MRTATMLEKSIQISKKFIILSFLLCAPMYANAHLEEIKLALIQEYKNRFPQIQISNIELNSKAIPKNFEEYKFLGLANAKFNKANGYIRAKFKSPDNTAKNIFFSYFIKAKITALRANKDIQRGDKLSALDYDTISVDFDKIPNDMLEVGEKELLNARVNIKKNSILRKNMFKNEQLIKKDDLLMGILREDGLSVMIEVFAIESGNEGEKIKLKTKDGKVMQGQIINKNEVLLQ